MSVPSGFKTIFNVCNHRHEIEITFTSYFSCQNNNKAHCAPVRVTKITQKELDNNYGCVTVLCTLSRTTKYFNYHSGKAT